MRKSLLALFLGVWSLNAQAQQSEAYFLSNPALTPDGQTVVFSFEGDLWKANIKDGQASRLTAMQGYETNPRISPDGRWIAFTGRQYGNSDLYLMPLNGGEIKQLTWHSAGDDMNSWSWDSQKIYFTSTRTGQLSAYTVGVQGGTPQRLFGDHYFLLDHGIFEHPSSGEIFFNDTWESSSQVARKRYKGPFNPGYPVVQSQNQTVQKIHRLGRQGFRHDDR
jgi:tricorn protease